MDNDIFGTFGMDLDDVRKLELTYSRRTPGKANLFVEYVGGRVKVFEVDRFLIERLLEQLEDREAWPTVRLDSTTAIKQDRTSENRPTSTSFGE